MPEESVIAQITLDTVKVERLVREFLTAQKLTVLPQNVFGDAVSQFVDKDDKHAMEAFVDSNLADGIKDMLNDKKKKKKGVDDSEVAPVDDDDSDALMERMEERKSHLEELFEAGHYKRTTNSNLKPKPAHWDSDMDGHWADNAAAIVRSEDEDEDDDDDEGGSMPPPKTSARGRGKAAASTRGAKKATASRATAAKTTKAKKKAVAEESEEEEDVVMLDDDDEEDEEFPPRRPTKTTAKAPAKKAAPRKAAASRPAARQTQLSFGGSQSQASSQRPAARGAAARAVQEIVSESCERESNIANTACSLTTRYPTMTMRLLLQPPTLEDAELIEG